MNREGKAEERRKLYEQVWSCIPSSASRLPSSASSGDGRRRRVPAEERKIGGAGEERAGLSARS